MSVAEGKHKKENYCNNMLILPEITFPPQCGEQQGS